MGDPADSTSLTNFATAPQYALDGVAAAIASLLGFAAPIGEDPADAFGWGRPLALVAIAGLAFVLVRRGQVSRSFWVVLAVGVSFWLLAGLNEVAQRAPTVSRYQYMGAIFVLLVAAEPLRGVRLSRTAAGVVTVVTCAALASNLSQLSAASDMLAKTTELERAGMAAFEIARDEIAPEMLLTEELIGTGSSTVQAGEYFYAVDRFGSPAYTQAELEAASEPARAAADRVLAVALGASLAPAPARASDHCPIASRRDRGSITVDVPASGIRLEGGPSAQGLGLVTVIRRRGLSRRPRSGVVGRAEAAGKDHPRLSRRAVGSADRGAAGRSAFADPDGEEADVDRLLRGRRSSTADRTRSCSRWARG